MLYFENIFLKVLIKLWYRSVVKLFINIIKGCTERESKDHTDIQNGKCELFECLKQLKRVTSFQTCLKSPHHTIMRNNFRCYLFFQETLKT